MLAPRIAAVALALTSYAVSHAVAQGVPPSVAVTILAGRVIDSSDTRLGGVSIQFIGGPAAVTNAEGVYLLRDVPAGPHLIFFKLLGYRPEMKTVTIAAGVENRLDVELEQMTPLLDRVTITKERLLDAVSDPTGFDRRRQLNNGGVFITEGDIMRRVPTQTEDLFKTVPFIGVGDGGVLYHEGKVVNTGSPLPPPQTAKGRGSGQCKSVQVFVNGTHVDDGFSINTIPSSSITGIEIYADHTTVPPQFASYGTLCGTVIVWTR